MSGKFCSNCGGALTPGSAFCDNCGTPVPGSQQPASQAYTPPPPVQPPAYQPPPQPTYAPPPEQPPYAAPSGPPLHQPQAAVGNVSPKSKTTLALLTFFVGVFGAHKFYIGKPRVGLVILVWFIVGEVVASAGGPYILTLPLGIWVFVDWIRALQGKVKDKDGLLIAK
jgi:TM2 domain-containing membrane protein YozV